MPTLPAGPGYRRIDPDIVIFENTREAWLNRLVAIFRPFFDKTLGYNLPDRIWISVGKPNKGARAIGICHPTRQSDDHGTHIFIHPVLRDEIRVGGIVAHELCHAALDCEGGHGAEFQKLAGAIGLVPGPSARARRRHADAPRSWTSTLEGPAFISLMEGIIERIGPYPHAALRQNERRKKRNNQRLLKVICQECGFSLWSSKKWLVKVHTPFCLNGECEMCGEPMEILWPEVLEGAPHFEKSEFEV